jgi:hypothetical protein
MTAVRLTTPPTAGMAAQADGWGVGSVCTAQRTSATAHLEDPCDAAGVEVVHAKAPGVSDDRDRIRKIRLVQAGRTIKTFSPSSHSKTMHHG